MSKLNNYISGPGWLGIASKKAQFLFILVIAGSLSFTTYKTRQITGVVCSAYDKKPLAGVQIHPEGSTSNTYSDAKGHYSITVPNDKARLIFTLINYKPDTLSLNKSNTLDAYLSEDVIYSCIDTVQYRASEYKVRSDTKVEDLLKKMKGIKVDPTTGNINQKGQAVTTVRLGDRSFKPSPASVQEAIKNLPADIVKRIQVVDDEGDQDLRPHNPGVLNRVLIKPVNTESYGRISENNFIDPKATPLSTFAVDVDAASYSNVRRFINSGQLPPKDAVRIEELINYFHYDLPEPGKGKPVAIQTELASAPWNTQHQLVRIGLKAKNVQTDKLPPSNLVFLLDVSGSMETANKLPLVKASMKMLVDQLRPIDHVAIVVYAGEAGLKLESTPGDNKQKIKEAIDALHAGGSTAGGQGIKLAYQVAREKFIKGGNNRIILATDGDFNIGASSDKDMEQLIEDERGRGVSISILGFGIHNLKDSKMERMADKGHGNYAYIDNITEATKSMVSEFGGTLFTVAKDVKMQVEFNPAKVQAYRLLGYEDRLMAKEDFNNDSKVAGDMGVGHTVTALYEIIPVGVKDDFAMSVDPLKYQKPSEVKLANNLPEVMTVKFRYKEPDGDASKMESVNVVDKPISANKTSDDFRFAAAVAEYGMLLRDSRFKQNSTFSQLIALAKSAKGKDDDGYRAEFIRLAESAKNLMKSKELVMDNSDQ